MLTHCISLLSPARFEVSFDEPVPVKVTEHSYPILIHGACCNETKERVSLLDGNGEWHELNHFDAGYAAMAQAVYSRLSSMVDTKERKGGVAA